MYLRAGIALAFVLTLAAFSASQVTAQTAYNVVKIDVEGNRVTTGSLILSVAGIDIGSPLTATNIQSAIERLYALGIFSDVKIEATEVSGGLKIAIVVAELPKLSSLNFVGNKEIKTKDLREKLGLGVGGYISPYLIHLKKQQILEEYAGEGYFQAEVTSELKYNEDSSEASLTYSINEKSKVKVERVVMTGNSRVSANELVKKMRNRKRGFLRSSDFAEEKYPEDLEKIVEEYRKRGFVDAYVISDSTRIDSSTNRMTIYLEVYEGPLYYFGTSAFSGNEILKEPLLKSKLKFEEGEVFNNEEYEQSLYELYTTYQEVGHLHSRITDERVTRSDSILDILYAITEGLPSHVNLVRILGNTKTRENVIRREISMLPGQVFNRSLLIQSVRDIMALNFFTNALPEPVDLPNGDVDIEFKIEEKQTGQVSAGAGYNSQDKVVGNVGLGIPNLGGRGQNLSFNIEFGGRRNSVSISFTEPWLAGRPTLLGLDVFSTNRRWFEDYTEQRQGGSVRLGRRLRWPDRYFRAFTSYRLERTRYHDFDYSYIAANSFRSLAQFDTNRDGIFDQNRFPADSTGIFDRRQTITGRPFQGSPIDIGDEWNTASRLGFTLTRDSRDLPEFATKGSVLSYTFETTGGFLGGYWNYQKHSLALSKFIPLFWKFSLAAKVQYSVVTSPSGDDRILLSDRFSPGGTAYDGVIRGYDDGNLTPDSTFTTADTTFFFLDTNAVPGSDPANDTSFVTSSPLTTRVRGKYLLVTNLEIQVPIVSRSVFGLLFFDAGNSWLNRDKISPFVRPSSDPNIAGGLYKGVGFGFRVAVPGIGTIGFDFAYPLDKYKDEEQKWKPHFQIGTTFR
ncbi:MAG: outer membrane protein assembly factor BamA [candidate division Zixibacteria bacterium]|nr:outer membrane protein assembly factor BamA [candidate division Zixibacteria bacterium]